jgi:hypothetical protein
MPLDALVISIAVTAVFVGFAVVLAWADHQTTNRDKEVQEPKRRSL